jgi:ferredoxin
VTYIIAEPCIDIKDLSCVDVCPVEAIFPEDALPDKWNAFVEINYAYDKGADVINQLTQKYADENNVQNEPID